MWLYNGASAWNSIDKKSFSRRRNTKKVRPIVGYSLPPIALVNTNFFHEQKRSFCDRTNELFGIFDSAPEPEPELEIGSLTPEPEGSDSVHAYI